MNADSLIIAMPTRGIILTEVQTALEREVINNNLVPLTLRTTDMPIPICRNYLIEKALEIPDWTHILLMDDDVVIPEGGLKDLFALKADVALIDYPSHTLKGGATQGTCVKDKDGTVAWAGLGCTLVKREVFEKLPQPWFVNTNYKISRDNDGRLGFYAGQEQGTNRFSGGEDVYFFLQCRKENFTIKQSKLIARHLHIESLITTVQNQRYQSTHKIVGRDTIETEMV